MATSPGSSRRLLQHGSSILEELSLYFTGSAVCVGTNVCSCVCMRVCEGTSVYVCMYCRSTVIITVNKAFKSHVRRTPGGENVYCQNKLKEKAEIKKHLKA